MVIKVSLYTIWEEIHHLHHHKSFQLWILNWATQIPEYDLVSQEKAQPDVKNERVYSSYLFHKMVRDAYEDASYVDYSKPYILYSHLTKAAKPFSQSDFCTMILADTGDALGPCGSEGQNKFLDEEEREAMMDQTSDPASPQKGQIDSTLSK